jgi:hypothetical protein
MSTATAPFVVLDPQTDIIVQVGETDDRALTGFLATPAGAHWRRVPSGADVEIGFLYDDASGTWGPRPSFPWSFDKASVQAGVEGATLPDVPAGARVRVASFPEQVHGGGDLVVGFRTPGTHEVVVEAFPWAATAYTLEATP